MSKVTETGKTDPEDLELRNLMQEQVLKLEQEQQEHVLNLMIEHPMQGLAQEPAKEKAQAKAQERIKQINLLNTEIKKYDTRIVAEENINEKKSLPLEDTGTEVHNEKMNQQKVFNFISGGIMAVVVAVVGAVFWYINSQNQILLDTTTNMNQAILNTTTEMINNQKTVIDQQIGTLQKLGNNADLTAERLKDLKESVSDLKDEIRELKNQP